MRGRRLPFVIRNRFFAICDLFLTILSATLGFVVRLDVPLFWSYLSICFQFVLMAIAIKLPIYYFSGLYRRYWRYASIREMVTIVGTVSAASALLTLLVLGLFLPLGWFERFPRSVLIIDWLLSIVFVGASRFAVRLLAESGNIRHNGHARANGEPRRLMIMGAGDAGAMVVREIQANPGLGYLAVGLLDDYRAKVGMTIHGVLVQGTRDDIPRLVKEQAIDEVLIAMPAAPGRTIREIVSICQQTGVPVRTMPGIYELISGQVSVKQVREIRIEDLLRRTPIEMDGTGGRKLFSDSVVLVTGAGGSIGSELCRQVARNRPKELLLLGHGENSIHEILLELRKNHPDLALQPVIADVRERTCLQQVLKRYQPEVVFHTAAHKHVPLMEANVAEAVLNNVFGTLNLLEAAEDNHVPRFVLVSTDKAVNSISIMGATKRIAELLVRDTARRSGRAYVVVRFGNVLGSRGSVVPLFQRQIAAGGPVTVTHPEMQRYFMTIPEAVQLIIQAAVLGQGGEILVLDMGAPIRVVDLAADLIRLSGLEPGRDIEITFTGLRPGEKLCEQLFSSTEEPLPTSHPKILCAQTNCDWDSDTLHRHLEELRQIVQVSDTTRICAKLQEIVPEYRPYVAETFASVGASLAG